MMITTPCFSPTQQFVKFFEEKFEQFIKENGSTTKEFYSKVKASALEDPEGENSDFVQVSTSGGVKDLSILVLWHPLTLL